MKILMISHEYPPIGGGGANACHYLGKGFASQGDEVTLITANYHNLPEISDDHGITVYRVNSKREYKDHSSFKEMLDFLIKARPVADKLVKKQKYDVCLVFFGIPSGVLGYYLKKKYKLPYVIRLGGGDIPGAQKRFAAIYRILTPAIKTVWKNANARVANSEGLRKRAYGFCNKYKIDIISNGVDSELFSAKGKDTDNSKISILFVSRIIEGKGLQYIIPEIKRIVYSASRDIVFDIVGDGPYKPEVEKLVAEYNVSQYVHLWGHQDKSDVVAYYQNADLFILPSKSEGMPNVVLEAMACGLPIVMTPCEGSQELIEGNGFISPIDGFVDKIIELINGNELRKQMSIASANRAKEMFSWEKSVAEYRKIIL